MQFTATLLPAFGLLLTTLTSAQSVIDYSKLPACAKQCSILAQAEANCVPPAAPVTNQDTYQSCVCQSGLLATLKTSPSLCQSSATSVICSAADAALIEQYYIALCNGPTVTPTGTATTAATSASTGTSASTATSSGGSTKGVSENTSSHHNWFSSHWRWVLMLIIIFLFMIVASILGVWLKRRHERRVDARRANMAAHDAPVADAAFHDAVAREASGGLPAPPPMRTRSPPTRTRSGTVNSISSGRLSRKNSKLQSSDPVVWGPHQHASTWSLNSASEYSRQPRTFGRHEQIAENSPTHVKEVKL